MPFEHHAIDRKALAGTHPHQVVDHDLADVQFLLPAVAHHARDIRLQREQLAHRLRAARLDDEGKPFRKNVIVADHHRDAKKWRDGEFWLAGGQSVGAAGQSGEGTRDQQHMLIDDAAAHRLPGHAKDMPRQHKDHDDRKRCRNPAFAAGKMSTLPGPEQRQCAGGRNRGADGRPAQTAGAQHQKHEAQQTQTYKRLQHRIPEVVRP